MDIILDVDSDITVHDMHALEWAKYSIDTFRVETMSEAIRRLANGDLHFFVNINADSIPHFMSQLAVLSDITALPIIIISKNVSTKKRMEALDLGADAYERLYKKASVNVSNCLKTLKMLNRRTQRALSPLPLLISGDVILSKPRRKVYVKDTEIITTNQEFNILQYLMQQPGIFISNEEILRNIWNGNHEIVTRDALWSAIKRLRKKLKVFQNSNDYITSLRDVGYRFQ